MRQRILEIVESLLPRRSIVPWLLGGLLVVGLLASGCASPLGRSPAASPAVDIASIDYTELPEGLGMGYPVLSFEGIERGRTGLVAGQTPANFRMVLDDGRSLTLADLQGRPVLINFWATWCGPCRLEMPDIVRHHNEDADLIVLAVNVQEGMDAIEPFAADFGMNMPIVRDRDGELRRLYDLRGMPTSIFINRDGVVTAIWPGVLTPNQIRELLAEIL